MIPRDKTAAVKRGLREAFGETTLDDVRMLSNCPRTALVLRIVVQGTPYLLRIINRTDAISDPTNQFHCMRSAAKAGLAPHVWYTSNEDRISITDFVTAAPFPLENARHRMPAALRALHALPPFPEPKTQGALDGFVRKFQAAGILPAGELAEPLARYTQLTSVCPSKTGDMVSSHNDLKPENYLFDGQRVWLVDWEAAFLNDRYFDLAIVANFVTAGPAEERAYLEDYFEHPPEECQLARFFLTQQRLHMFYAAVFLFLGTADKPLDRSESIPEFRDFHRRIWSHEVDLADSRMRTIYGMVHWQRFLENMHRHEGAIAAAACERPIAARSPH